MSLRSRTDRAPSLDASLAVTLAIPIAALLLVPVWLQVLGSTMLELDRHLLDLQDVLLGWMFAYTSLLYLLFLGAFVLLYVRVLSVDVPTGLPDRNALATLAAAVCVPTALLAVTAAITIATDAHYMVVTGTDFPWFAPPPTVYVATTLWILVGILTAVGLFHVVLQSDLRERASRSVAMVAATAVGGSLFATQGLSVGTLGGGRNYPVWGEYLALIAFAAAIGLAVVGTKRADRDWQRFAAVVPLAVVIVGTVGQIFGVVDNGAFVGSPIEWVVPGAATVLFGVTAFTTVGLAAYAYERSETVLAPTLVYAITYLASAVAVTLVEKPPPF